MVDGNEFVAEADNIDKARLIPDWAALGLASTKPGKAGQTRPKNDKPARPERTGDKQPGHSAGKPSTTKPPTNKPAADKPTPAE
ncbi:hypothetical protein [Novilysobacter viscosus]|uniref:hypothetical protein n=1 Tax=Novilysobacter viscosus TaxID=3098602 RepID=UPI003F882BA0